MTPDPHSLRRAGRQLAGGTVVLAVGLGVSGLGTLACVVRGYKADAGISLETSDLHVQPACIGRLWFVVEVRGKPAGHRLEVFADPPDAGPSVGVDVAEHPEVFRHVGLLFNKLPGAARLLFI